MVSAIKLVSEFVHRLPRHGLSPETTEGYEGYVHPHAIQGGVERAVVKLLLRDFATKGLDEKARMLTDLAEEVVRPFPAASVEIERRRVVSQHEGGARSVSRSDRAREDRR